jgi:hypothetical protein
MPHQFHGMYALERVLGPLTDRITWLNELGEIGEALKAWEQAIVNDLGGEDNLSAMERSIIEMATKTHLFLTSVDRFLWSNRLSSTRVGGNCSPWSCSANNWPMPSRYMNQLSQRRAKPVQSLDDYKERYGTGVGATGRRSVRGRIFMTKNPTIIEFVTDAHLRPDVSHQQTLLKSFYGCS